MTPATAAREWLPSPRHHELGNALMLPEVLPANLIHHQYRAGGRIAGLRGLSGSESDQPEEWLGSTVGMLHEPGRGVSHTADGCSLADLVRADPSRWLGASDPDTAMLFKLVDTGQRGPVHAHPDRTFAREHLGDAHGKTEAWFIVDAKPGARVYVGWRESIDPREFAERRDAQDSAWMLARMNSLIVEPGMAVVVPAGQVHSVDEGLLIAEIQEPTDYSIVIEWSATTLTRDDSELGLGWELASQAVDFEPLTSGQVDALVTRTNLINPPRGVREVLAPAAGGFFSLSQVVGSSEGGSGTVEPGFGVLLVLDGTGEIVGAEGSIPVKRGDVVVVPFAFGEWQLAGAVGGLLARGVLS